MGYNLERIMHDFCPFRGRGEDAVIEYIKTHDTNPAALYKEVIALGDDMGGDFLSIVLSSTDYNVFTPWYKAALIYFKESGNKVVVILTEGILDYYKEDFDKVGDLNEI